MNAADPNAELFGADQPLDPTGYEKMVSGQPYAMPDPYILGMQARAAERLAAYNAVPPFRMYERNAMVQELLGACGTSIVMSPVTWEYGAHIRLGKGVFINSDCIFLDGAPIVLGNHVAVGPRVMFLTAGHPLLPEERQVLDDNGAQMVGAITVNKPINIMDNCWIGAAAIICGGVTIGEGTTIGAGSVVTRDIPARVLAAGNPARVIREFGEVEPVAN